MKTLSLRQPWAELVVSGAKPIENRRWNTNFRGEFLIHASKGMTKNEYAETWRWVRDRGFACWRDVPPFKDVVRGGIVGIATLSGVLRPGTVDHAALLANSTGYDLRWHMAEQYGFVLRDIRRTRFVPYSGALGFFSVPDEIVAQALAGAA